MSFTSCQVVEELGSEPVGVDDAGGLTGRHRDQFQHSPVLVGADHEEAVLTVVFVLDEPDGVRPCVLDVSGVDPVFRADRTTSTTSSLR